MNQLKPKSLKKLLSDWAEAVAGTKFPQPPAYVDPDVMLTSLVEHSALVEEGSCFVARVRTGTDGHAYIGRAIANGASLLLGQRDPRDLDVDLAGTIYLQVDDSAVAEAWLAAAWYGFPSNELVITGVTGTDGKTTTVNILFNILRAAGIRVGMLSTLKASIGGDDELLALHVTTPEAPVVQHYLRRMVDSGLSHCILEVTSHGLAQERVGAISFDVAVVTNITHEHLDYHGNYEEYLSAKAQLIEKLSVGIPKSPGLLPKEGGGLPAEGLKSVNTQFTPFLPTAVLNRDDSSYARLSTIAVSRSLTYGLERQPGGQPPDVTAGDLVFGSHRTRLSLVLPDEAPLTISASLVGTFNVYNMLAAAAAAFALGIEPKVIGIGLGGAQQLAGRMQRVQCGQSFLVVVDFAHTPNALAQAIAAGRRMSKGRLIMVFGSAGKRDVEKRRLMAELSAREADVTILTAEDPRTESLDEILEMMAAGCLSQGGREGQTFWRVPDRGRAIHFAVAMARPEDLVLICGKGHEQSMCFGVIEHPWDDVMAAETALNSYLAGRTMPDLGLPTYDLESRQ
jgi:UDP-N-acetylmuramoyl-L-alanyl-D-glutamate--2,6-diaminopimelate ligase